MDLKLARKYFVISLTAALTLLMMFATPAAAAKSPVAATKGSAAVQSHTIRIAGGDIFAVNQFVENTYHFNPGTLFVRQGDSIVLMNGTKDVHTLSLVAGSLLPTTIGAVFGCGAPPPAPPNICAPVLAATFPNGPPSGPPSGPPPICPQPPGTFCVVPFLDGGVQSATPPGLDTPWTLTKGGDSVVIFPKGGPSITMTVTAHPGTILHFMCVFHPWMQGQLVVASD